MFRLLRMLLAAPIVLAVAGPALAQVPGDHYKVYNVEPKMGVSIPVFLRDQFGGTSTLAEVLDRWANPVNKNGEGIHDPELHYSWYRIHTPEPPRRVLIHNQFGANQEMDVFDGVFLLNPAVKFPDPVQPVPVANHYKCYQVVGRNMDLTVQLADQFGPRSAQVLTAELLCNPASKETPGQPFYPVIDPNLHLACYRIGPPLFYGIGFSLRDQFGLFQTTATEDLLLCVPSTKEEVVPTEPHTWGRVKGLYR